MTWAWGEMADETVVVACVTCVWTNCTIVLVGVTDTAGIGGDGKGMSNTLIVIVPAAVGVGAFAVKYGNCNSLLKLGLVDVSLYSGTDA